MPESVEDFFGPIIHSYTREQGLADGVLVDVSSTAREAGFTLPVAVTQRVHHECIAWTEEDNERKMTYQDEAGRLWDVVWMGAMELRKLVRDGVTGNRANYQLYVVPKEGRGSKARLTTLSLVVGPGDKGEAVVTIMAPDED